MATVALLGTLDTKGEEVAWIAERLQALGVRVVTIDVGSFSTSDADHTSDEVIKAAGEDPVALRDRRDRGEMMTVMGRGASALVTELAEQQQVHALLAIGGSGGSSVAAPVMQALPVGFPKLLVSTMASGDVKPYVGAVDVTLMYSVVDVAGINSISEKVFANAAAAAAGMATAFETRTESDHHKPLVGMTMFGLTTPAADDARHRLEELGYEVLVFHATGTGGRAMEKLISDGLLAGVCDITTTELGDELVGGVLSAGPDRLEAAGKAGLPQVVSLGALDMINFGGRETISKDFADRQFLVHNPTVTLMRTTPQESAELGKIMGGKLAASRGTTELFIPLRGVSGIDVEGGPFWSPDADQALIQAVKDGLQDSPVTVHELDQHINDPGFGRAMADALHAQITSTKEQS